MFYNEITFFVLNRISYQPLSIFFDGLLSLNRYTQLLLNARKIQYCPS